MVEVYGLEICKPSVFKAFSVLLKILVAYSLVNAVFIANG